MLQCYCQRDFFTIFGSSKTYLIEDFSIKKKNHVFYFILNMVIGLDFFFQIMKIFMQFIFYQKIYARICKNVFV